ncbi:hypothetical protein D3C78_1436320 [compost metagenome]
MPSCKAPISIGITQISACIFGVISIVALTLHLMLAEVALTTGYIKGNNDPVAFLDFSYVWTDLLNNAHGLMTNNIVIMHTWNFTVKNVQI